MKYFSSIDENNFKNLKSWNFLVVYVKNLTWQQCKNNNSDNNTVHSICHYPIETVEVGSSIESSPVLDKGDFPSTTLDTDFSTGSDAARELEETCCLHIECATVTFFW